MFGLRINNTGSCLVWLTMGPGCGPARLIRPSSGRSAPVRAGRRAGESPTRIGSEIPAGLTAPGTITAHRQISASARGSRRPALTTGAEGGRLLRHRTDDCVSHDVLQTTRPAPLPRARWPGPAAAIGRFDADIEGGGPTELRAAFAHLARRCADAATNRSTTPTTPLSSPRPTCRPTSGACSPGGSAGPGHPLDARRAERVADRVA